MNSATTKTTVEVVRLVRVNAFGGLDVARFEITRECDAATIHNSEGLKANLDATTADECIARLRAARWTDEAA
jgi:hypothetical protein